MKIEKTNMSTEQRSDSFASNATAMSDRGSAAAGRESSVKTLAMAVSLLALLLLLGAVGLYVYFFGAELSNKQEVWGQFGDYLGGTVNPWLGFLTLLSVLYTLHLQRELLNDSKAQAMSAKEESAATRRYVAKQLEQMEIQAFESTYFRLIRLREDLVTGMRLPGPIPGNRETDTVGRDCFKSMIDEYAERHFSRYSRGDHRDMTPDAFLRQSVGGFFGSRDESIHPYFRSTFELLALIDAFQDQDQMEKLKESSIPDSSGAFWTPTHSTNATKQRYVNLIVANLTYYESLSIALYALGSLEKNRDFALIERYGLLRHLRDNPIHLEKDETCPEQGMIYALRKTFTSLAFEVPKASRTKY